ncbi:hypothetical protein POPA111323_01390 [Polynucleobacter paneuropaeus]|uniref:Uncharacterized protein n=1 Tax=Polynucleobacter paneuropaeus TaxID=2527775 RepID=A0A2Z4JRY1_9BURK|nr:hypothetical protein [Polynucleobacter paneuropaeus]AWW49453.1 hypothetical protein Pas1_03090 [Polynucleobacter paneuropaeus]
MNVRYAVKSNGKNKLIERTYYKKRANIFYIENIKSEFNIISVNPLDFSSGGTEQYILLSDFKDVTYSRSVEKRYFSSGVSIDDKKIIKKLSNGWQLEENLKKIGWKFFDITIKVVGESEIKTVPFNHLSLQATESEIAYENLSELEYMNYVKNGIPAEKYNDIASSGNSGFCETDVLFELNNEEVNIQKHLEREFKKKNQDERLISRLKLPTLVVTHFYKRSYATIDIFEEFDPKKLTLDIEKYVYKNGANGYYYAYLPIYDGQNFEFESSGLHNYTDILLIDSKGKIHSIDISDSKDDESEFDD